MGDVLHSRCRKADIKSARQRHAAKHVGADTRNGKAASRSARKVAVEAALAAALSAGYTSKALACDYAATALEMQGRDADLAAADVERAWQEMQR